MRCQKVRDKLDRLSRQKLATGARDHVEAHLNECADCRRHLAAQERVAILLTSLPKPPSVPEGFGDRLAVAARKRRASPHSVPGSLRRLHWLRPYGSVGRRAAQAAVLAGGLLTGVLMGQQTWRSVHPSNTQQARQVDPAAVYELDYLSDSPGGSLAESFLTLTGGSSGNGA